MPVRGNNNSSHNNYNVRLGVIVDLWHACHGAFVLNLLWDHSTIPRSSNDSSRGLIVVLFVAGHEANCCSLFVGVYGLDLHSWDDLGSLFPSVGVLSSYEKVRCASIAVSILFHSTRPMLWARAHHTPEPDHVTQQVTPFFDAFIVFIQMITRRNDLPSVVRYFSPASPQSKSKALIRTCWVGDVWQ
jgi:hypothetical protein